MTHCHPHHPASQHGLQCYLVEDSPVIRQNLVATLEEMLHVQVIGTAEDEASALAWIEAGIAPCDIMIIDIFLKSGTGIEVLKRARQSCIGTRLVVLTNFATEAMRRHCLSLGADRVFDKSSELEELLQYCSDLAPASPS